MADVMTVTRSLSPLVEEQAAATEAGATLAPTVVDAFRDAGLFGVMVPAALGGTEADLVTALEVFEEVSRADGSTGWSLLANATTSAFAGAYCGDRAVTAMFADGVRATHAGQFAPYGTAVPQGDGTFRVSGRYSFGSGSGHADWVAGGAFELHDGEFVIAPSGLPVMRPYFVPRDEVQFLGNWDVMGLSGTGSYDYEIPEQVVDEDFTWDLLDPEVRRGGPVYRLGVLGLTSVGHAAFALGVGRRALDELLEILETKHRLGATDPVRDQQIFRHDFAHHDAALLSARAFTVDSFGAAQAVLEAGRDVDAVQQARLRQCTTYATRVAVEVVRFAYTTAGTDALRPGPLQRCFRDIHAATQHVFVDNNTFTDTTAALLDQSR